jgi:hypothetical protein
MMVRMQISPPHPLSSRHRAKQRMSRPGPRTRHKCLQPLQQPCTVSRKLHRPRPSQHLVHLLGRWHALRPLPRYPQRQPLVQTQWDRRTLHRRRNPRPQRAFKRIRQMTDHLVAAHRTPHPTIRSRQPSNPSTNRRHILHPQKRLHQPHQRPCLPPNLPSPYRPIHPPSTVITVPVT